MKVRCRNIVGIKDITLGKIYDVVGIDDGFYIIINDVNRRVLYFKTRFIPLKKDRDNKISKLIDLL